MVDAAEAQTIVLRHCEAAGHEKFAIQSCDLSERGHCWVVRANSVDYVRHGRLEHCYVGVSAYLVDKKSGDISTVGSGQSVEQYLEDKEDLREAGDGYYILEPDFTDTEKAKIIRLRQAIQCSPLAALRLLSAGNRAWLTGARRVLRKAQSQLDEHGVTTSIVLRAHSAGATEISESYWTGNAALTALKRRAEAVA